MHFQSMFKGDYIAATEFDGKEPTLTIARVEMKTFERDKEKGGGDEERGVVYFKETNRGWRINYTNAACIAAMFGDQVEQWCGHKVTLYADPNCRFGADRVFGIRVKGSPELTAPKPITVKYKSRYKPPYKTTLQPTGGRQQTRRAEPEPEPPPSEDFQEAREPGMDG